MRASPQISQISQQIQQISNIQQIPQIQTAPPPTPPAQQIAQPTQPTGAQKPKPNFRCDVCSYETSVARNLRIHMTSEKHTHNMAVLQNNIKHLQALTFLQSQHLAPQAAGAPEAALADLAYNQALMIQLLHSGHTGSGSAVALHPGSASPQQPTDPDPGLCPDTLEPPADLERTPPSLFSCLICAAFDTNSLDDLNAHVMADRARGGAAADHMLCVNQSYVCRLCR